MDYPSVASRRNIHNAEGAIPYDGGTPTSGGPDPKYDGTGNPNPAGVYDCDFFGTAPIRTPFPKDNYTSKGDINSPAPLT